MDSLGFTHERRHLVERANQLIEKHCLPVPRFFASRFINFEFWTSVFTHVFGIRCDTSLRTPSERVEMIKSCLNILESLIGKTLDHIRAERLLNFDVTTMKNLIEIVELWDSLELKDGNANINGSKYVNFDSADEAENIPSIEETDSIPSSSSSRRVVKQQSNKCDELADTLYKSLQNQTLALEIEKKIKLYLGDVTASERDSANLRASRQSIVRTRAIHPTSTFDFNLHKMPKRNRVLSGELEKLFPEISTQVMEKIKQQEQRLLMSQRNIRIWQEGLALNKVNRALGEVISQQRLQTELAHKAAQEQDRVSKAKAQQAKQIALNHSTQQVRTQKALLQKEINTFHSESTGAYLNARSYLERILMAEFVKLDAQKKQQINEIREYLQNHYETETDHLRSLLENFEI